MNKLNLLQILRSQACYSLFINPYKPSKNKEIECSILYQQVTEELQEILIP